MTLAAGTRLGVYEIVTMVGAGGMGDVYRARDTKLKREVALKVLRSSVASDADRLSRFDREARMLARPMLIVRRVSWSPDGRYLYAVAETDADVVLLDGLVR